MVEQVQILDANIEEPLQSIKALEAGSRKGHDEKPPEVERALSGVDESKRRTLIRLLRGAAFAAPIVASFSMDGLTISEVQAHNSNHPNSTG